MGIFAFQNEESSNVAPAKLYKALTKYYDEIIPKVIEPIQSVEIVEGNGGPGTIKKITAVHDGHTSFVLHKVDAIDEANLAYDYSIIGGAGLDETLEKITFESKILAGPDGGSIGKINIKFHTKGDVLSETVRDQAKFKGIGLFKAVEGYVLAHPDY
ncbi:putative START-like domain, Bet v I type allergen [Lupinus albus]|uniref:Putative START-like domain, Bet v I type allergen n=1 Tax=Lupinus albus TaxID=3870 RepID=A0A6A4P6S8_LUPAL|nr:putative START-like domain, Bet v I type allergen [Lupinus albus]